MSQRLGDVSRLAPRGSSGQRVSSAFDSDYVYLTNSTPEAQTVGAITVGDTIAANDVFTLTVPITDLDITTTEVVSVTAVAGDTATTIATRLVAALNANPRFLQVAIASNTAGVITIRVRQERANVFGAIAGTATAPATITAAPTITAFTLTASLPFGYGVGTPTTGDPDIGVRFAGGMAFRGVAEIDFLEQDYRGIERSTAQTIPPDAYRSKDIVKTAVNGQYWVNHLGTATIGAAVFVNDTTGQFQVASTGGTATGWRFTTNYADQINIIERA